MVCFDASRHFLKSVSIDRGGNSPGVLFTMLSWFELVKVLLEARVKDLVCEDSLIICVPFDDIGVAGATWSFSRLSSLGDERLRLLGECHIGVLDLGFDQLAIITIWDELRCALGAVIKVGRSLTEGTFGVNRVIVQFYWEDQVLLYVLLG